MLCSDRGANPDIDRLQEERADQEDLEGRGHLATYAARPAGRLRW